jgi:hypothetical protein
MTSRTAVLAGLIGARAPQQTAAQRLAAFATAVRCIQTDAERERLATLARVLDRVALRDALALARKSRLARLLGGTGDLWDGNARARQFELLTDCARTRRAVTFLPPSATTTHRG